LLVAITNHLYHLGDTEWQDVEAGVRYALAHGAQDVILFGWSMGGCLVKTFLRHSPYARHVRAIVLDAPILDWETVLIASMREYHAPVWFAKLVQWLVAHRLGLDFATLNSIRQPPRRIIPTLLFHGTADTLVPVQSSDLFVQAHPDLVTYYRVNGADHVQSWNVGPQVYEERLKTFLTQVIAHEQNAMP
jgi:alpha-beta hydrolase superfamily lysophospholipase